MVMRKHLGLGLVFLLAFSSQVFAAGRTEWTAGNGVGLTWTTAFNTSDFTNAQLQNGWTTVSTVIISNGTALDQFMDYSVVQSINSGTITAGANIAVWLIPLAADGSTYTSGSITAGTASSYTLPAAPVCVIPLYAAATQTVLTGTCTGIVIPPGTFKLAEQNNAGGSNTYTSTTQVHDYRTYNIQNNN
jgi:hypothetical protein